MLQSIFEWLPLIKCQPSSKIIIKGLERYRWLSCEIYKNKCDRNYAFFFCFNVNFKKVNVFWEVPTFSTLRIICNWEKAHCKTTDDRQTTTQQPPNTDHMSVIQPTDWQTSEQPTDWPPTNRPTTDHCNTDHRPRTHLSLHNQPTGHRPIYNWTIDQRPLTASPPDINLNDNMTKLIKFC